MSIDYLVKDEVLYCEHSEFVKTDKGVFMYESIDGVHRMNLPFILSDYKDWLIENKIVTLTNK